MRATMHIHWNDVSRERSQSLDPTTVDVIEHVERDGAAAGPGATDALPSAVSYAVVTAAGTTEREFGGHAGTRLHS